MGIALADERLDPRAPTAGARFSPNGADKRIVELVRGGTHDLPDPDPRGLRERRARSTAPSAARPMPWCTCWRLPAGSASTSRSTTGIALGRDVPCLVDLKPSGRFLMEEFFDAGGLPVVMERIADRLHLDARDRRAACSDRRSDRAMPGARTTR